MDNNQTEAAVDHKEDKCDITPIKISFKDAGLPEIVVKEIEHVLHLAAHILKEGGEVPMLFVGMDESGAGHLIDPEGIPAKPLIRLLVRRAMTEMKAITAIMISEGWSLPESVTKQWANGERPEGMQIKDHPEAYEVLMLSAETLNGTWAAQARVSPVTGEGVEHERTVGELEFQKATAVHGHLQNLLQANAPEGERQNPMLEFLASMLGGGFVAESLNDDEDAAEEGDKPDEVKAA